jgi:prepilin-type N-terminal cleavage/methylation domain-containing protein
MTCRRRASQAGFTIIEVMIAMLVVTVGLVSMAQLIAVTTVMHSDARQTSLGTEFAQAKLDELMKLNLATAAAVQVTPVSPDSLENNVTDYFDTPTSTITRRWKVEDGPAAGTRYLTVRVLNASARKYGSRIDIRTILRQW